jgi:FkbM family methyltransferase
MAKAKLLDGTEVYCLRRPEAKMLDHHVDGYLQNGISIQDGDTVFDVGANIGIFGIRVLQKAKDVKVYCFEPIPDIAEVLSMNAKEFGNGHIHVMAHGVSNEPSRATFTYFPNTPALSTLHPEQWDENPTAFRDAVKGTMKNPPDGMKWMGFIPPIFAGIIAKQLVKGSKKVDCELKTLSSVIDSENVQKIDLLKIDCEGGEYDIFTEENASYIRNNVDKIIVEYHNYANQIVDFANKNGFMILNEIQDTNCEVLFLKNKNEPRK